MKFRLLIVLLLIVATPLAVLAALGVYVARSELEMSGHRTRTLLEGRLHEIDTRVQQFLDAYTRPFLNVRLEGTTAPALAQELAGDGKVRQFFVLDRNGALAFPMLTAESSDREREFFRRTTDLWRSRDPLFHPPDNLPESLGAQGAPVQTNQTATPFQQIPTPLGETERLTHGWYTWYWGPGLNFVFWWRDPAQHTIGVELDRARLIAELIAALPDTGSGQADAPLERIVLTDSQGTALYKWGGFEPEQGEAAAATIMLGPPFTSWRLDYFGPLSSLASSNRALWFNLAAGLLAFGLALAALGFYFYRESAREMREAAQRVTFVNQVSHELKTPLTTIRMYAELLEEDLADDPNAAKSLGIIVSESQRLSRLIGNILTFSRKQRQKLTLHAAAGRPADTLRHVIESARPALEGRGITIEASYRNDETVLFDADAFEQILNNLINNVEKYAVCGGFLGITIETIDETTVVQVSDRGPGIPEREREHIFAPFYRLSDKTTDGVAGTGIGLAIARELARLHGGGLRLVSGSGGAIFELRIHTPPVTENTK